MYLKNKNYNTIQLPNVMIDPKWLKAGLQQSSYSKSDQYKSSKRAKPYPARALNKVYLVIEPELELVYIYVLKSPCRDLKPRFVSFKVLYKIKIHRNDLTCIEINQ